MKAKRTAPKPQCPICGEPLKRDRHDSFLWFCLPGMAETAGGPHDVAMRYAWNNAELHYCKAPGASALPSSEWAPWACNITINPDGSDHSVRR